MSQFGKLICWTWYGSRPVMRDCMVSMYGEHVWGACMGCRGSGEREEAGRGGMRWEVGSGEWGGGVAVGWAVRESMECS